MKNMEDKTEIMSNEYMEINNIIALAKADSEIETILLSEIAREFKPELEQKQEMIIYEDKIYEVIELAKHDMVKMTMLMTAILENQEINNLLLNHFKEVMG